MPESQITTSEQIKLPLLPLRDVVVFPHMVIPLFVGRTRSIKALEISMEADKKIVLVAQKTLGQEDPGINDIYNIGCLSNVIQMLKLPDGTVKVLIEGVKRITIENIDESNGYFECEGKDFNTDYSTGAEIEALRRTLIDIFEQYIKLNKKIPAEILSSLRDIEDPERIVDTISAHFPLKLEQKQNLLENTNLVNRFNELLSKIESEIDILQIEKRIKGRVKKQMEKSQRDYYLHEQLKAIQKELGDNDDISGFDELEKKIIAAQMSKEAKKKAESELSKLRLMPPMSAESTVVRNFIETLISLPWKKKSKVSYKLDDAEAILDADHYGLEKVKERILEHLAVQQRVKHVKAPILCLVGPPGVGKTSLGQSIAKATNRKFTRIALGGIRDEAEIRGHRRTYIGSMPGKIMQNISKVGVKNPIFLLDEIDKLGMDYRGDPSSALLEVLDPEQNNAFQDHYIEVDFDLSDVMFLATSNTMNIPSPLLDRMEIIHLSGYTEEEKSSIAKNYLIPKQKVNNGIEKNELTIENEAILDIIRYYTREAGVRSLEREIAKICRKFVKNNLLQKYQQNINVSSSNLKDFLGIYKFDYGIAKKENQIGQVTALAWTETGGDLLTIEVANVPGKGVVQRTGSLGDVMKESIEAALTVVRSRAAKLNIDNIIFEKFDIHVHVPEGATPKDGPSAGIAITTAMVSSLTNKAVLFDVAMTGEITLRGEVLPIGGLKEKLLAALRGGIKTVLIPEDNLKDLSEIPNNVKEGLKIIPVRWIDQVLELSLYNQ
ncbi:Lon protease [Candidatus Kinetoplastibacterium sorsogonicusi]|uniref:Lon protease n=1 Tax=Candidatus Kinetoplastidibacterium kentomonadis TaxID=1576550 RepID=A0A3S7J9L3_9PROT|nr:Lon protease [Candidatus Kinetoplastibacterium sorsogonicusi]